MAPKTVNWSSTLSVGMATPFFNSPAATAPDKASTEPTERSMPPDRMIRVMPSERQRLIEICRSTLRPFSPVRNLSEARPSATIITASAIRDWNRARFIPRRALAFIMGLRVRYQLGPPWAGLPS